MGKEDNFVEAWREFRGLCKRLFGHRRWRKDFSRHYGFADNLTYDWQRRRGLPKWVLKALRDAEKAKKYDLIRVMINKS